MKLTIQNTFVKAGFSMLLGLTCTVAAGSLVAREQPLAELEAYAAARYVLVYENKERFRKGFSFPKAAQIPTVYPAHHKTRDGRIIVLIKRSRDLPPGTYAHWASEIVDKSHASGSVASLSR